MEEVLLRHRALIDDAVHSLEETTSIEGFLNDLEARVAALRLQEPSFWELRVVEYIHNVVTSELKASVYNGTVETSMGRVRESVRTHLTARLHRLVELLESHEQHHNQKQEERFLESFWGQISLLAPVAPNQQDEAAAEIFADDENMPPEAASYEAITFDDLQFETGSIDSAPSPDEIPMILEALIKPDREDRYAALQRLAQISPLELVHCSTFFLQIAESLCHRLLDPDTEIARQTLQLLYSVVVSIEDPIQFLDLYLIIVNWVGASVSSEKLAITDDNLLSDSDATIQALDAYRFFHLMICRVPYHWIHFPGELLVRVICSTSIVLMLDPHTSAPKKTRPLDVLSIIDSEAKWFAKWTLRVPSRMQLFASLYETDFLSDLMYTMTRVRPFEADVEPLDRARMTNTVTILAISARFQAGQAILKSWKRLPAHIQHQRRYTEWLGLEKQFRLEIALNENDNLYRFNRMDCKLTSTHRTELEDGGPLGDQAITAIALSSIVMHLLDESNFETFDTCLRISCQIMTLLSTHQEIFSEMLEMLLRCGIDASGTKVVPTVSTADELEARDPWFPYRRPKPIETVTKYAVDAITKRGLISSAPLARRCAVMIECIVEMAAQLSSAVTSSFASALSHGLDGYLSHILETTTSEDSRDRLTRANKVFANLQLLLATTSTPFTVGVAMKRIVPQLAAVLQHLTDQATNNAVLGLVLSFTQLSSAMPELVDCGLWRRCQGHFVLAWQANGDLDDRVLQLLLLPSAMEDFVQSNGARKTLEAIQQTCAVDLDTPVALNAAPSEAPIHLRQFSRTIASLRAVVGTQHAATILQARSTDLCKFIVEFVVRHKEGACRENPQSEDLCTIVHELLTATAGCIPSMIAFYELLASCQAHSRHPVDDHGISACGWLATSLSSSLAHIGGHRSNWIRPQPLYHFSSGNDTVGADSRSTQTTADFVFSSTTACALEQMMASIEDAKRQCEPLDMVMLSQATWEILSDIKKIHCCDAPRNRALTVAFGKLIYVLAMSGQSKLEGKEAAETTTGARQVESVVQADCFPSDAERKLMNTYYKDYCARLGLKATPTMLHVISKVFGTAAMDCFSCTLLMILDQTYSEQEIVAVLQYCATCPNIYVLWPRIVDSHGEQQLPALLPVAQAAEMILEVEFPQIFSTLRQCHCSVLTLVLRWHTQCYWNYLAWDKILLLVYLNFLYGVEFQVYSFVAVVKHFEPTIRAIITRHSGDPARAYTETLQTPIEGFCFHSARNLILTLRSTYHDRVQRMLRQA